MDHPPTHPSTPTRPHPDQDNLAQEKSGWRRFLAASLVLLLAFSLPLYQLVRFALSSELYSYILLIPLVSGYLVWIGRRQLTPAGAPFPPLRAALLLTGGAVFSGWAVLNFFSTPAPALVDLLALAMAALVLWLAGFAALFLGRHTLRELAFPLAFLIFLAPLPVAVEAGLETVLQHGSSWVAQGFFELARMPVYRDGTYFQLPGFSMQVAPQCSGIRSTLALFLTSLIAGRLFLRSAWKRTVLVLIVLPLALLRNGFRVFVIGELCVQIRPEMIDSWIHHQGGPVFFALSLIPFSLILYFLYKSDRVPASSPTAKP